MNALFLLNNVEANNNWILLVVMAAFLVLILLTSIIPQRKRQKQMATMLANLKAGDEIKTIGGMVGKIYAINEETGIMTINVGTDVAPTLINIDKVAIYSVAPAVAPTAPVVEPEVVEVKEVKEEENK